MRPSKQTARQLVHQALAAIQRKLTAKHKINAALPKKTKSILGKKIKKGASRGDCRIQLFAIYKYRLVESLTAKRMAASKASRAWQTSPASEHFGKPQPVNPVQLPLKTAWYRH